MPPDQPAGGAAPSAISHTPGPAGGSDLAARSASSWALTSGKVSPRQHEHESYQRRMPSSITGSPPSGEEEAIGAVAMSASTVVVAINAQLLRRLKVRNA